MSFSVFAEEILSVCLIEDDKVLSKNSCHGTINIGEDFTYEGEFENGQLNGKGTFVWHKSEVYNEYVGEFKDDKLHGKGTLAWVNGDISTGNFIDGEQEGFGKKIFKSGDEYTGEFKGSFFNGKGKYVDADGTVYEGEFKDYLRHGQGKMTFVNGCSPPFCINDLNGVSGAIPFGRKSSDMSLSCSECSIAFAPPLSSHLW